MPPINSKKMKKTQQKKRRGHNRVYDKVRDFESYETAHSYIVEGFEGFKWVYLRKTKAIKTTEEKIYFKCSIKDCPVQLQACLYSESTHTTLNISDDAHDHQYNKRGISDNIKTIIDEYYQEYAILRKMHRYAVVD